MRISFSPTRSDSVLTLERRGDALVINGETFDFSPLPEEASLPSSAIQSDWFASSVSRNAGVLSFTLVLPIAADATEAARFPAVISAEADGPIPLPSVKKETTDGEY